MTDKELILNLWREGVSITDTARRLGCSRGKVSGAIYRHRDDGFVHTTRGYYENTNPEHIKAKLSQATFGYGTETLFSHAKVSADEAERRNKLKELLT